MRSRHDYDEEELEAELEPTFELFQSEEDQNVMARNNINQLAYNFIAGLQK